jgi:hypothetical protein
MIKVAYRDNRGDKETQFGFVYFSDGTRIGYAPGAVRDRIPGFPGLFPGTWGGNTDAHFRLASEYLTAKGVNLNVELAEA